MSKRRVLVCGCGIAGLTAAHALTKDGHEVTLVERVEAFDAIGAGIVLQANALASLDALGIGERVRAAGHRPSNGGILSANGDAIVRFDASQMAQHPTVADTFAFYRPDLHDALAAGLDVQTYLGTTVREFDDSGHVLLSDGTALDVDLLVGADGIHSTVRAQLNVSARTVYAGYTCWRVVCENRIGLEEVLEVWGRGKRVGLVPLTKNRIYAFLVADAPPGGHDDPAADAQAILGELFGEFDGKAGEFVRSLRDDFLMRHDINEHDSIEWGRGVAVLIGDAAHAMTPNMGQGAAQSIEDAVALALVLRDQAADVPAALRAARDRRVRAIKSQSRRVGAVAQWHNPVACWARNTLARGVPNALAGIERMLEPGITQAKSYMQDIR
ncbi:MAG: FAD-dependent monooxygenase [bacterium]